MNKQTIKIMTCIMLILFTVSISAHTEENKTQVDIKTPEKESIIDAQLSKEDPHKPLTESQDSQTRIWFLPKKIDFKVKKSATEKFYDRDQINDENFGLRIAVVNVDRNLANWNVSAKLDQVETMEGLLLQWQSDGTYIHHNPRNYKVNELIEKQSKVTHRLVAGDDYQIIFKNPENDVYGYYSQMLDNLKIKIPAKSGKEAMNYKSILHWQLNTNITVER